jgi:hypothetical protein
MERKLVSQGRNALTVTLPAKWAKSKGLKAGGTIFLTEHNNDLLVSARRVSSSAECTIDMRGQERSMVCHRMIAKYIEGYDTITILHDRPAVVQEMAMAFIGMVVEEHTATRSRIRSIVAVPEENFEMILRRAVHMFVQVAHSVEQVTLGTATPEQVKAEEQLLDNTLLYCLRYLSKYERTADAYRLFLVCATIELAADQLKLIARHIGKQRELGAILVKGVEDYARLIFTNDVLKMHSALRAFRGRIGNRTFADGLAYTLAEILYNYLGYTVEKN